LRRRGLPGRGHGVRHPRGPDQRGTPPDRGKPRHLLWPVPGLPGAGGGPLPSGALRRCRPGHGWPRPAGR